MSRAAGRVSIEQRYPDSVIVAIAPRGDETKDIYPRQPPLNQLIFGTAQFFRLITQSDHVRSLW